MIDVGYLDIMRQSSSSMVSSSPFTYLTYMLIDIPDELVGSYTWLAYVSFYPPRVSSYTKLSSSTLFLSININISIWSDQPRSSWSLLLHAKLVYCDDINFNNTVMMIAIRIAMMMMIGYVYDIDYDGWYHLHASLLRVRSSSSSSWSSTSSCCMNRTRRRSYRWWWVESLNLVAGIT